MSSTKARDSLLGFLDRRAFDPVLRAKPERDADADLLADLQRRTEAEKKRYHDEYATAEDIRTNFQRDLHSSPAKKVHAQLHRLKLPALPDLEDEFFELCDEQGVGARRSAA